jgi:hypothetical protein
VRRPRLDALQENQAALPFQDVRQSRAERQVRLRRRDLQIRRFRCVWDVWDVGRLRKSREQSSGRPRSAAPDRLAHSSACDQRSVFRAANQSLSREQKALRWKLYKPAEGPFAASPFDELQAQ